MLKAVSSFPAISRALENMPGRIVNDLTTGGATAGSAVTPETLYAYAYSVEFPTTVKTLAVRVSAIGTASNVKAALYLKRQGSTICDLITDANPTGIQTNSGTGTREVNITDISLNAGTYIAATLHDGSAGATFFGFSSGSVITAKNGGYTSAANFLTSNLFGYSQSQSYAGGFPATIDLASMTPVTTNVVPQIGLGI